MRTIDKNTWVLSDKTICVFHVGGTIEFFAGKDWKKRQQRSICKFPSDKQAKNVVRLIDKLMKNPSF